MAENTAADSCPDYRVSPERRIALVPLVALAGARWLTLVLIALLPLVAWPGLARPFSTPKLWLLVAAVIVLAPFAWIARSANASRAAIAGGDVQRAVALPAAGERVRAAARMRHVLPLCWLASWTWSALLGDVVSLEALLLALAGGLFAMVLSELEPEPTYVAVAHVAGATGVAAVSILQWVGLDPFALAGWIAPVMNASPRLRVYGTFGNPNFVAAALAAVAPLTVSLIAASGRRGYESGYETGEPVEMQAAAARSRRRRRLLRLLLFAALTVQIAGLAATGSRAGAVGVLAAAVTWMAYGLRWQRSQRNSARAARVDWRARWVAGCVVACLMAIGLIVVSTARPLRETLAGRVYIWQVAWPHAWEAPWVGRGPGAFELLYPVWEREAAPNALFAGPQQHAHNDYLEALIERGVLGPVTILGVLATCLWSGWSGWRRTPGSQAAPGAVANDAVGAGAAAMLAALGAIACVDFPLARPTEMMLWWSAVALVNLTKRARAPRA